jgi:hypothetical protein
MLRRTLPAVLAVAGCLTLAACGGSDQPSAASGATRSSSTTASTTGAAAPSSSAVMDAAAVLAKLKSAGLPITDSATVTEANDGNHLLGRPGQYVSKVAFADSRVGTPIDQADPGNDAGGSIEVFANASDAQARSDYIQQVLEKLGPMAGTEYHYLSGPVLVRVTGDLPPSAAKEYETAVTDLA